jgi:hypothetical protein
MEAVQVALTIALPDGVAAIAGLDRIDYDESFSVDTDCNPSPEDWARLTLEGAPGWMRAVMVNGWRSLGINLASLDSDRAVLGWPILRNTSDEIVLGIESSIGLTARIVIQPSPTRVVHSMLVKYESEAARVAWAVIAPPHRAFVRRLLDAAALAVASGHHGVRDH